MGSISLSPNRASRTRIACDRSCDSMTLAVDQIPAGGSEALAAPSRPSLQLLDLRVASAAFDDAPGARVVDAIDRAERHAQAAVDALLRLDRDPAEVVIRDRVDRVD